MLHKQELKVMIIEQIMMTKYQKTRSVNDSSNVASNNYLKILVTTNSSGLLTVNVLLRCPDHHKY